MFRFHAAYLYDKGAVEGFIGYGFSPTAAEEDCVRQMRVKLGNGFRRGRVVREGSRLTPEQFQVVSNDWLGILRAKRQAGHSVI